MWHFHSCHHPRVGACRGAVKDACVMAGKGYGFVTFEDIEAGFAFLEVRTPPCRQTCGPRLHGLAHPVTTHA